MQKKLPISTYKCYALSVEFKTIKKFKNDELKQYMKEDTIEYVYLILYTWGEKKYIQHEIQEVSADYF